MPVPHELVLASKAAFELYRPPALVAELRADAVEALPGSDTRFRLITFALDTLGLSVTLAHRWRNEMLHVAVDPMVDGSVCLEQADFCSEFFPIVDGHVLLSAPLDGWMRLTVRSHELGRPVHTAWVHL